MRTRIRMPENAIIGVIVDKTKAMDPVLNIHHVIPYYPKDSILHKPPFDMYLANSEETLYTLNKNQALEWAFKQLGGSQERLSELLNAVKPKPQKIQKTPTFLERLNYLVFHKKYN